MKNLSRGLGLKVSPVAREPNPLAHARNSTPYAVVYGCWYNVLDQITDRTNTHNPPSIPELIQTTPLPDGSWVSLVTIGMRIITSTGRSSNQQYEWLKHGDVRKLPAESTQPSPIRTAPQPPTPTTTGPSPHSTPDQGPSQSLHPEADSGRWAEVAVWEDGGQSAASVRSDE